MEASVRKRVPKIYARLSAVTSGKYMRQAPGKGPRSPSDSGPLRIVSGRLVRSINANETTGIGRESVRHFTWEGNSGLIRYGSSTPYAPAHEYGFFGRVAVSAHTRKDGTSVSPHVTLMNIPARPYLAPALAESEQFAADTIEEAVMEALQ